MSEQKFAWLKTSTAGWLLFFVALVLLFLGWGFGVSGLKVTSYILIPLAVVLALVGGVWALLYTQPESKD